MNRLLICSAAVAGLVLTPTLYAEPSLDDVKKKIVEKWSDVRTMSARIDMEINLNTARPFDTTGTFEYMREGDVEKKRMYLSMENDVQGRKVSLSQTVIQDSEYAWSLSEGMGQKRLFKHKPTQMEGTPGGKATFVELEEDHELKLLPDETVDGRSMYVIEAISKRPEKSGLSKYKLFFAKDNGVLTRAIGYDLQGTQATIINYTDVKLNEKIDPERFVFKNEENLQVIDMTRMDD